MGVAVQAAGAGCGWGGADGWDGLQSWVQTALGCSKQAADVLWVLQEQMRARCLDSCFLTLCLSGCHASDLAGPLPP